MNYFSYQDHHFAFDIHQQKPSLPYLLMLHGFMGSQHVFDHLNNPLKKYCNPITIDLLGHGSSSKPIKGKPYSEERQTDYLHAFIRHLEVEHLLLHGYSMGGRLALKCALRYPYLFKGLILESANCGIEKDDQRKQRRHTDHQRAEQLTSNFDQFLNNWQQLPLFEPPQSVNKKLVEKYAAVQKSQSPEALAASLDGFGTGSMSPCCDKLDQLTMPVLLIAGTADRKYQQINRKLVQKLPNAHFSSIEAGHRVHTDNADEFVQAIQQYIDNKF